jgi:hypothetical protein
MADTPKPAANEDAVEGDPAVIDRELARQDEKQSKDDKKTDPEKTRKPM